MSVLEGHVHGGPPMPVPHTHVCRLARGGQQQRCHIVMPAHTEERREACISPHTRQAGEPIQYFNLDALMMHLMYQIHYLDQAMVESYVPRATEGCITHPP